MSAPLFVSFTGYRKGVSAFGWCVFGGAGPIETGPHVEELCKAVERERGYDPGSLVVLNFRRLESGNGNSDVGEGAR